MKLLDKMYKYEMDPTRTVGTTERTRDGGRMDRRSETGIAPQQHRCAEGIITTPFTERHQGAVSIRKTVLPGMAIPMLKIRRPNGRLIFNMEITIPR